MDIPPMPPEEFKKKEKPVIQPPMPAPAEMPEFPEIPLEPEKMEALPVPPMPAPGKVPEEIPELELAKLPPEPKIVEEKPITIIEKPMEKAIVEEFAPHFIRADVYRFTIDGINNIRSDLNEAEEGLNRLDEIKASSDSQVNAFKKQLEDIEKKLAHVDFALFEEKGGYL